MDKTYILGVVSNLDYLPILTLHETGDNNNSRKEIHSVSETIVSYLHFHMEECSTKPDNLHQQLQEGIMELTVGTGQNRPYTAPHILVYWQRYLTDHYV